MNSAVISQTKSVDSSQAFRHAIQVSFQVEATPVVFIVNNDTLMRESLKSLIDCEGWRSRAFGSAQEFLDCPRGHVPSCLLLDISLPGIDGLELQRRMGERSEMPIIFVTSHVDVPTTVRAMKAGAVEFFTKPFQGDVLVSAIEEALKHSRLALGREAEMSALRSNYASLSPRERQVMSLVVSGLLNKQVGGELGISEITVKAHRGQVMQKMKADSLPDLVRMATRLGLTQIAKS